MKATVFTDYGPPEEVLTLDDVGPPTLAANDVLVRVRATSVNPADWHIVRGEPLIARLDLGLRGPKQAVPGCDVAGVVEAVGDEVTSFRPGDEVFGSPFGERFGAFAELAAVPADRLAHKPAALSFAEAAAVPLAGLTALQALRTHGHVEPGQRVLVVGASGGVGTFAVQIAKALGAHVTGVCSTRNVEHVRSLGADDVIDYTTTDVTALDDRYDLVVQLAGTQSASAWRRILTPKGRLLVLSGDAEGRWFGPVGRVVRALVLSPFVGQTLAVFTVDPSRDDLEQLAELVDSGRLRPVIERTYALPDVGTAIADVEDGHTRGKIVVTV